MNADPSIWSFIIHAGFVVKTVMLILLLASVASWTIITQRLMLFKKTRKDIKSFEQQFWSGINLDELHDQVSHKKRYQSGLAMIFQAGLSEYQRLEQQPGINPDAIMQGTQRAMRVAHAREIETLEKHLSFLATVGSTSPYVGLFGTVWGIMTSFQALGSVQQATIAMVAPGISEALIATAIGLFAAIPAVISYNRLANDLERINNQYETFQEEFSNILHRQSYNFQAQNNEYGSIDADPIEA